MIDRDGYRPNVAIVLCNAKNEVFWGKRIKEHAWQFPQGGIKMGESPEDAMYRELEEETGLLREHVKILGRTKGWLHYHVPSHWIKREWRGTYKGQKQIWYLLRLVGRDHDIKLRASTHPEFDAWRWHDYWVPLENVIEFKRDVYKEALQQLVRFLDPAHAYTHGHGHTNANANAHANRSQHHATNQGLKRVETPIAATTPAAALQAPMVVATASINQPVLMHEVYDVHNAQSAPLG